MQKQIKNYAFIDSQNLYIGVQKLGWKLDFKKFRIYLKEKYNISKAYIFIGHVRKNQKLYKSLKRSGYNLVFKCTAKQSNGIIKGNVDAELVLQSAAIDFENYDKAIIVSGDGDFYCLIKYLRKHEKFLKLLAPNYSAFSLIFKKRLNRKDIIFMNDLKNILEYKTHLKRGELGVMK